MGTSTARDDGVLLDLDAARAHVATGALRAAPPGPVGLELESHLVDLAAPADRVPWARVGAAVAALPPLAGGSRVTVEPGGQVELSGPPADDVAAAVAALRSDTAVVRARLAADGLGLATVGADPSRPPARVNPGARYVAMEEHFAAAGCLPAGTAMMTSTASLQVNLEAGPAAGWRDRVRLAHALGPVLVAVSACSPLLAGRVTGWRSSRQSVWGALDQARCGSLLGRDDPYASASPLMTAVAEHVLDTALAMANSSPHGRLNPSFLACLDELPSTTPLPTLRTRMANERALGLSFVYAAQTWRQMVVCYGEDEARSLFGLTNNIVVFGGGKDIHFYREVSDLLGTARVSRQSVTDGPGGIGTNRSVEDVHVLRPEQIRLIAERHALVVAENAPPILARLRRCVEGRPGARLLERQRAARDRIGQARTSAVGNAERTALAVACAQDHHLQPGPPASGETSA